MNGLPVPADAAVPGLADVPGPELASALDYARAEKAEATRKAYASDWRDFSAWCVERALVLLPASVETAAAYLASLADRGLKASTISRRAAAIDYAHRLAGETSPCACEPVKAVMRGIRRRIGTAPVRKAPAAGHALKRMLKGIPDTLAGRRDRALLLIGFAAALRRSELVALNIEDLEPHKDGLLVRIRKSKTDQEGQGRDVAVPRGKMLRPVDALEAWIATMENHCRDNVSDGSAGVQSGSNRGPLFRPIDKVDRIGEGRLSDRAVALIVKRYAELAKLDPKLFSGHSLRAGFVTAALEHDASALDIMRTTGHRRVETLQVYDRRAKAFKNHAGRRFL